jgi:translation initiation factor 3 subunit A
MHHSIKDIFKSYRAITQGQYSESLKCVLEYYRDEKLESILDEEIPKESLEVIRALPNIETESPSVEIIMRSMHTDKVKNDMEIRNKLKIVWEGYKSIVDTVKVNQKLEDVYMPTLTKIFDFVDRYNRVQEFKTFCRSLRTGLQSAFNKRDRSYQEKTIFIDIEKTDVNTRNIEIRLKQFEVTTKLELWGEAFTVLEDINTLMRVRKAPLKNSLRCQYYESLALMFYKNNFWHYHAFAYYNYYLAYLTKPKLSVDDKQNQADKLLLSILGIPSVTAESQQTK